MMLTVKKTIYSQPQRLLKVDWSNDLSKGLVASYTPIDEGYTIGGDGVSIVGAITKSAGNNGIAYRGAYQASNNYVSIPKTNDFTYTQQVTFEALINVSAFQTATFPYISGLIGQYQSDTSGGNPYYGPVLRFNNNATIGQAGKLSFILTQSGIEKSAINPTALNTNTTYHVVGTYDGAEIRLYVDGVRVATTTLTGAFDNHNNNFITLLSDYVINPGAFSHNRCFNGDIYLARIYNIGKTDAEVYALSQNPWQVFNSGNIVYFPQAGGITIIPATLSQSQTLGNISLIQQNILSVGSITQAQTLQNILLTQQNSITLASLLSSQSISNTSLTQNSTIATNSILETQSLTNITLVQQGSLTPLGLAVNVSLMSPSLTSANNLTVANLTSTETLTTPNIISSNILSLSNLASSTLLSTLSLTQQNVINPTAIVANVTLSSSDIITAGSLIVQSLSVNQTLLNISLTQQGTLTPNGILTSQALTQTNLVQANILTVSSILSSSTLGTTSLTSQLIITVDSLATTQTLQNLLLIQQSLLSLNSISSTSSLGSPNLTQQSTLIVSNNLHSQILENITLLSGVVELNLMGQVVYMLGENSNIYVIRADTNILINQ